MQDEPRDTSGSRTPPKDSPLQFSLRTILLVVAAFCVLFAILAALGIKGVDVLTAFGAAGLAALSAIVCVEIGKAIVRGPRGFDQ